MSYIITTHAVERYIKRFAPAQKFVDAKCDIDRFLRYSKQDVKSLLGDKTRIFENIRFVIKDENVCITVLPALEVIDQEELDFMQEMRASSVRDIETEIANTKQSIIDVKIEKSKLSKYLNELNNKVQDLENRLKEVKIFSTSE